MYKNRFNEIGSPRLQATDLYVTRKQEEYIQNIHRNKLETKLTLTLIYTKTRLSNTNDIATNATGGAGEPTESRGRANRIRANL